MCVAFVRILAVDILGKKKNSPTILRLPYLRSHFPILYTFLWRDQCDEVQSNMVRLCWDLP